MEKHSIKLTSKERDKLVAILSKGRNKASYIQRGHILLKSGEGKLNEQQQAYLVALACSNPPSGRERWTVELLTAQLVTDGIVGCVSPETVRLVLEKTNSSPGA